MKNERKNQLLAQGMQRSTQDRIILVYLVLVSSYGCFNKSSQTTEMYYFIVLEVRRLKWVSLG